MAAGRIGDGKDQRHVGGAARGDELLHAVQHPAVAAPLGAGPEVRGVGAGLRLGEAEGTQHLAARQRLQPALLLLGRAVGQERGAVGRVVDAHHRGEPAVARGDLLQRQHVGHHVGAGAAPFGRHAHAHEAHAAHLGQQRPRDLARRLPGADMRRHLLLREGARGVADQGLFFIKQHRLGSSILRSGSGVKAVTTVGAALLRPSHRSDISNSLVCVKFYLREAPLAGPLGGISWHRKAGEGRLAA